tara:strand:- start:40715 stop:41725 length:1011 start_codon:yes stop_codon:yes gene_type:complete
MAFITARAPFRISFFGGGTDYPLWYKEHGGAVLSTSINKHCFISCRYLPPYFEQKHRVVWSHIENVQSIAEILHPAVREGLKMLGFDDSRGLEIHHYSDLPARAGMASSSAFANAFLLALKTLHGEKVEQNQLFHLALELEQERLKENVGSQDQVATALGGFNFIKFNEDSSIDVTPVSINPDRLNRLQDNLMLIYTGTGRLSSEIAGNVIASLAGRTKELKRMREMVDEALALLQSDRSLDDFGEMLNETWECKKNLTSGISNPRIDMIYEKARATGALGGKLLGAGSSGFMVFYVPKEHQAAVRDALDDLLSVPFRFSFEGAKIISNNVDDHFE